MSGAFPRGDHPGLSIRDDRLAIRELVWACAYCAARRDAAGQMALFTGDTDFPVYAGGRNPSPTPPLRGRDAPAPMFDELSFYEATMHFSGQSTTVLDASQASGVADCPAHHVEVDGWTRSFIVAAIGYLDSFVTQGAAWFLSRRKLMIDWTETCLLATG